MAGGLVRRGLPAAAMILVGLALAGPQLAGGAPKASPSISTQVSGLFTITDTATVSGGASPTGLVAFELFGPDDPMCTRLPFAVSTASLAGGTATSAPVTLTQGGTYSWIATYSGDDANDSAAGVCGDPNETVRLAIDDRRPSLTTQASPDVHAGGSVDDVATLTGVANPSPTGVVTFSLYGPDNPSCAGAPAFVVAAPVVGDTAASPPVVPTADGTYQWVASYSGDAATFPASDGCGDPDETVHVTAPPDPVDLKLVQTASAATVPVGGTVTYTLSVKNKGPGLASGVTLVDLLPDSASFVSVAASQGTCTVAMVCNLGLLQPGQSATVTMVAAATAAGALTSTAAVLANERDLHPRNNSSTVTTEVVDPALHLTNTVSSPDAPPRVGSPLVYTLTVVNRGPGAAAAVALTDALPAAVHFSSVSTGAGSCVLGADGATVQCDLGTLAEGGQVTVLIDAVAAASGKVTDSASLADAAEQDADSDQASIRIRPAAGS